MSKLSSFHKQIVSKYFDNFNDYDNLFKVDKNLSKLYFSSFNYINLSINYVLSEKEIINILNRIRLNFSNLKTLYLKFNISNKLIKYLQLQNIILNYDKFIKLCDKELNIKITFDSNIFKLFNHIYNKVNITTTNTYEFKYFNELINNNIILGITNFYIVIDKQLYFNNNYILNHMINNKLDNFKYLVKITTFNRIPDEFKNVDYILYKCIDNNDFIFNTNKEYKNLIKFINLQISTKLLFYNSDLINCINNNNNNEYIENLRDTIDNIKYFPMYYEMLKYKNNKTKIIRLDNYCKYNYDKLVNYELRHHNNSINKFKIHIDNKLWIDLCTETINFTLLTSFQEQIYYCNHFNVIKALKDKFEFDKLICCKYL